MQPGRVALILQLVDGVMGDAAGIGYFVNNAASFQGADDLVKGCRVDVLHFPGERKYGYGPVLARQQG